MPKKRWRHKIIYPRARICVCQFVSISANFVPFVSLWRPDGAENPFGTTFVHQECVGGLRNPPDGKQNN